MEEIWRGIPGFEGYYAISNCGRVKSRKGILKLQNNHKGYPVVTLVVRPLKLKKTFTVHRLVANVYIPNPEQKPEVNHIDGVKTNNCISNLEWNTGSENCQHAIRTGLAKPPRGEDHFRSLLVLNTQTGIFYHSTREAYESANLKYTPGTFKDMVGGSKTNRTAFIKV